MDINIRDVTILNGDLLKPGEQAILVRTLYEVFEKYSLPVASCSIIFIDEIERGDSGNFGWRADIKQGFFRLCYHQYLGFGFDNMLKTFKHEVAHAITWILYERDFVGNGGHTPLWAALCMEFGGHMNADICKLAGLDLIQAEKRATYKFVYDIHGVIVVTIRGKVVNYLKQGEAENKK